MFVAKAYVLIHVSVAETRAEFFIEHKFLAHHRVARPSVGPLYGMVVGKAVGIVPAVIYAVGKCQEVALSRIADRLSPCKAGTHAVAPCAVVGPLVVEVYRVAELEKSVPRIRVGILAHVAETIVGIYAERAPATCTELVVVDKSAAEFHRFSGRIVAVDAARDRAAESISGRCKRGVVAPAVVPVP